MKKGITLKDIAKKLNMSISTVSKALNDDETISTLTKERVKSLADQMNYVPNEAARNFKLSKTYTISIILPNLLDQFFALAINGVDAVAKQNNYNVIFSQSQEDAVAEEKILHLMIRNRVDGIIMVVSKNTVDMKKFEKLEHLGIPVVFMARQPADLSFDYVLINNEAAAFDATEFLIRRGHKYVAHLMAPATMLTSQLRLQGYKNALIKNGIPVDESLICEVDFSRQSIGNAMAHLLKQPNPPTGVIVYKTYVALDAITYLKQNHPDKANSIDFVGFGNLPLLEHLDAKPVASIEEHPFEMGRQAARLLFDMMNPDAGSAPKTHPQHLFVNHSLVQH